MPRKLTQQEIGALRILDENGSVCPGTATGTAAEIVHLLAGLERRRMVEAEPTDDGNRYHLTTAGRAEARK